MQTSLIEKKHTSRTSFQSGVSLIETLLYIALASVLLLTIASYWSTLLQTNQKTQEAIHYASEADFLMATISSYIRSASAINSPTAGITTNSTNLTINGTSTTIAYDSGNITVTKGSGAPIAINTNTSGITSLTFTNLGHPGTSGTVRIVLTLTNNQSYYASATIH